MKKIVAIMLALALVFAMSTVSFAAITENNKSEDAKVEIVVDSSIFDENGDGEPDVDPDDVDPDKATYKVDIDATGAVFTYIFDSEYNVDTHKYDKGSWKDDYTDGKIVVTNHSNTSIEVTAAWKVADGVTIDTNNELKATFNGVTATLATDSFDLGSAVNTSGDDVPSFDLGVSVGENDVPTVYETYTLDFVTITIAGK